MGEKDYFSIIVLVKYSVVLGLIMRQWRWETIRVSSERVRNINWEQELKWSIIVHAIGMK